ncbi:hypothetical protein [Streptomyces griseus]|uniref:hypothetical protein n=1 Tax=Streptomyces griseus TaxID=1911 RepID=UPI003661EE8F
MSDPTWYAQPFRADGGITANGLLNQLGNPSLSWLTLLVREAAQNSWDARLPSSAEVRFRLDLSTVGAGHSAAWRRLFAPRASGAGHQGGVFRTLAQARSIRYLAVSDRGTSGLAGPTRSDVGRTERREWARFVLNSGDRDGSSSASSGGTYGYGKSALYQLSKVGCVLVYTRFTDDDGHLRSRFMGVAIQESFWVGDAHYTGRHWWGLPEDDHCEPLCDAQADATARELGIPGFSAEETGTTLVVVEPDLTDPTLPDSDTTPELSVAGAGAYLADAAAWNLWPIMLPERPTRMTVSVTANGVEMVVPDAESDAVLAYFASAHRTIGEGGGEWLTCQRPKKDLGRFAHAFTFGATVSSPAARELGLEGAPHHVCLMRGPELVVRYHSGPERSNRSAGYVGVFRGADELDPLFARSEPPTHDAWEPQQLQGREATFVRTTVRRVKERCDVLSGMQARPSVDVGTYAMGSVAHRLGHLLAGPGGTGAAVIVSDSRPGSSSSQPTNSVGAADSPLGGLDLNGDNGGAQGTHSPYPSRGSKHRRPTLLGEPRFEVIDERPVVVQRVRVHGPDRVEGMVRVLTGDGGAENASPLGAEHPEVYGWRVPHKDGHIPGEVLFHAGEACEVELIVTAVADVLMDIKVVGRT